MGYLDEIISGIKTARSTINNVSNTLNDARNEIIPQAKTMAGRSLDGTLQFPCLAADTVSIETAATMARTMERVYASFAQSVISMNSTIDISADRSPVEFLKRFHRNVKTMESSEESGEFTHYMEAVRDGRYSAYVNESLNLAVVFNESDKATLNLLKHNAEMLEQAGFDRISALPPIGNNTYLEAPSMADVLKYATPATGANFDGAKEHEIKISTPSLTEADVKKQNDMQPYTVQVRLMAVNDKKEFVQFMDFVMGIKVVLHTIKSEEIVSNVIRAISNHGLMFKFLRWTTGEKSLFGDLLFNVSDVKLDAANRSKGSSRWWQTLKRMKERKTAYNNLFSKDRMIPNSTMVLTEFEVNQIKEKSGFDLNDPKIALKVINELFLMAFVVISDSTETFKIIYADAGNEYQFYSLAVVEKEVQASSNKIGKELVRMISR